MVESRFEQRSTQNFKYQNILGSRTGLFISGEGVRTRRRVCVYSMCACMHVCKCVCVRDIGPTALLLHCLFSLKYIKLLALPVFLMWHGAWGAAGMIWPSGEECLITDMLGSLVHGDNEKQKSFSWLLLFLHRQCISLWSVPREGPLPLPTCLGRLLYINLSVFLCFSSIKWVL